MTKRAANVDGRTDGRTRGCPTQLHIAILLAQLTRSAELKMTNLQGVTPCEIL